MLLITDQIKREIAARRITNDGYLARDAAGEDAQNKPCLSEVE